MLATFAGTARELPQGMEGRLGLYRYGVFVEELGWDLPTPAGSERDQFDREDTVYVVAEDEKGQLAGCARLLPTTRNFLLGEVFPQLMNGLPVPCSPEVWELSRFSTRPGDIGTGLTREEQRNRFRLLFRVLVEAAMGRGATRLITFTALGVERILRQIGIHSHRVGPPQPIDGKPVIALWIELDEQTTQALEILA